MKNFITMILPMVRKKLSGEYKVLSNSIVKTNDIKLNALTISKNDDVVAKNIYLGQYYEMYESGCVIDKIVEQIVCEATDNANELDDRCREYVTNMYDYEKVKDKIVIKLVSLEKNAEYLKDKMYIKYLDFAMVFQLLITMPENRIMTSAVLSQVHKLWGVSEDELYVQALKNMQSLLPASLESLNSKILKMAEQKNVEFPEDIDISGGITPLYVLSNKYMTDE